MDDATTPNAAGSYRVLARKYRPSTFADLIGQDAMVRTISNAFESGRIPQAWVLTGVRGVGKTTTARILARALNYELPDGSITGPTIDMPTLGVHCQAIMESRHLDVIEMDAASHNGVEDVRAINEAIRYAPVSARYKVYILDEVHMLSGAAFNALLKTLEEPPAHAKFVFATTEIRKVPITVLSRCQRFDLRRVDAALLVKHLQGIAEKEAITTEPEALGLIARAAEGSVRDALSLLDQAIAHAAGPVRAEDVRGMLGLADRTKIIDLFEALMRADLPRALQEVREQYDAGADPAMVLGDLAEFTHFVTRVKIVPALADDVSLTEAERTRGRVFAAKLSMRVLARTWQMLLKGIEEVAAAGRPLAAAEMVLVRIAYAADLPTPDEVIRSLGDGARGNGASAAAPGGPPSPQTEMSARAEAPRAPDMPRGGPRAALATAPAELPATRAGGARRRGQCRRAGAAKLRGARRARRRKARPRAQERARARRAAGAVRGRPARIQSRTERAEVAHWRAVEKTCRLDRAALDGDRVRRARPAEPLYASADAQSRAERRRARRPVGAGGADPISRRRDRRCANAGRHGRGGGCRSRRGGGDPRTRNDDDERQPLPASCARRPPPLAGEESAQRAGDNAKAGQERHGARPNVEVIPIARISVSDGEHPTKDQARANGTAPQKQADRYRGNSKRRSNKNKETEKWLGGPVDGLACFFLALFSSPIFLVPGFPAFGCCGRDAYPNHVVPLDVWMRFDHAHAVMDQQRKKDRDAHRHYELTRQDHRICPNDLRILSYKIKGCNI